MDDILDKDTLALLQGKYTMVELSSTFSITQLGPRSKYVILLSKVAKGEIIDSCALAADRPLS